MILITGASGFIGSYLTGFLNRLGEDKILLVDKLGSKDKWKNVLGKKIVDFVDRDKFLDIMDKFNNINFIYHLGACADTTENNLDYLMQNNFEYSKALFRYAEQKKIPFIYASSAATYGSGESGYRDNETEIFSLRPINPYGFSKQLFDEWVLRQTDKPQYWVGFKFFNVYGPNEYHKGRMASVVFHAFNQIKTTGKIRLFKSHREGFKDGQQRRDFIYVKDVAKVLTFCYQNKINSGIYNLGTGISRTFYDLALNVVNNTEPLAEIEYFDMPEDLREKYQYFTEANMDKLKAAGYVEGFTSLEDGIKEYVTEFLKSDYKIF